MHKNNKAKAILLFSLAVVILIVLAIGYAMLGKLIPSKDRVDVGKKLDINMKDEYALCLDGDYLPYRAYKKGKDLYLPLELVKAAVNNRFYFNEEEEVILYTYPDETVECSYRSIEKEANIPLKEVKEHSRAGIFASGFHTVGIITEDGIANSEYAVVKKDDVLREKGGIKSGILFDIKKGEQVFVKENMEKWAKVFTFDGRLGYIQKKNLDFTSKDTEHLYQELDFPKEAEVPSQTREYKICMGWHLMMNKAGNSKLEKIVSESPAMNVIAPTWFSVKDNEGNIESFADKSYVDRAHKLGLEVWGVVNDINYKEAKARVFLKSTETRAFIIDSLISEALEVGMDGINLDFESIPKEAGEDFIQFVRELSVQCRKYALVLSIDNYVPMSFNRYFNRREQGSFADYVVIMGYDEHYAGSNKAGSVASINYVRNGIEETLREVPAHKVINGVPAYMRVWSHTETGLKTDAISMYEAGTLINKYDLHPEFDEGLGQYYSEYTNEKGVFSQIWFEDKESLNRKMDVMIENKLAGVAIWRLGLETPDTWEVFARILTEQ